MGARAAGAHALSAVDTTILGEWDFDQNGTCNYEGWTSHDLTADGQHWHVDDFAGLGGGTSGVLVALEGNQSLWLGERPSTTDPDLCNYAALPGYGNGWTQYFCTVDCQTVSGDVLIDYIAAWDSEPAYDGWTIFYDRCDDNWDQLLSSCSGSAGGCNDGTHLATLRHDVIPASNHSSNIRIRFSFFSDGAFSDEDGLWPTDGALILDSLTVTDATGIVLPTETFESEALGTSATLSGNWRDCNPPGYGDFAGLFNGATVLQQDDCVSNISCLWGFFSGSTANYSCKGFPTQPVVPYVNSRGQYIENQVRSPLIPVTGTGTDFRLEFDTYSELKLDPLIFATWGIRSFAGNCPGPWKGGPSIGGYQPQGWYPTSAKVGVFIDPAATHIQVYLGVVDMCGVWCGVYGTGACHSHTPLYDNVRVIRLDHNGPQWLVQHTHLFQDNFAGDGTLTGTVRADAALDLNPMAVPSIRPGDSVTVTVSDPVNGLSIDPMAGGAAVYAYVTVLPAGQPTKTHSQLSGDPMRYPVVDSYIHNGITWYCVRMDTAFNDGAARADPAPDRFCVDLNDNLFTPGDTVLFAFCAQSAGTAERTYWSEFTGTTDDIAEALDNAMEFTCLPTGAGPFLYMDGFDGRGAQPMFDAAFQQLGIYEQTDRYDKRGPYSTEGNGLGGRVVDAAVQLADVYSFIIWNTGDLPIGTIGDGTGSPEKSNDALVLNTFLDELDIVYWPTTSPRGNAATATSAGVSASGSAEQQSSAARANGGGATALDSIPPHSGGIYFSGDDFADEFYNKASPGADLVTLRSWIQGSVTNGSHRAAGYDVSPLVVAAVPSCFSESNPDTLIAYGGCPILNDFDLIAPAGPAALEMSYHGTPGTAGAIISQVTENSNGAAAAVMLSGFSYHEIRQHGAQGGLGPDYVEHLGDILYWLGWFIPTGAQRPPAAPGRNQLAQNYPNPFNPSTTITFEIRDRAHVTIRVYNVAGQLVRTLVDDVRAPGVTHTVEWDGRNTHGQSVATGMYFYRIATRGFSSTRKMVLLK
jgi:hypothetical protein